MRYVGFWGLYKLVCKRLSAHHQMWAFRAPSNLVAFGWARIVGSVLAYFHWFNEKVINQKKK